MASGKRPKVWGSGMMDDSWRWAADLGSETGLAVQVSLTPTRRHCIWRVVVRVLEVVDGAPRGVRIQHAVEWPDASYTTLDAMILQALSHLSLRLEEDALQQAQRQV